MSFLSRNVRHSVQHITSVTEIRIDGTEQPLVELVATRGLRDCGNHLEKLKHL